jgi:hypothetical protein
VDEDFRGEKNEMWEGKGMSGQATTGSARAPKKIRPARSVPDPDFLVALGGKPPSLYRVDTRPGKIQNGIPRKTFR